MHKTHLYITTLILVLGTLAGVYLSKYLSRERVDLRYTLSEPIPLKFGGETGFAVQQVSVVNNGENAAKNVHLKIPKGIVDFQLDKNYATDVPQIEKSTENFEVVYPELPPQGHFRLVLKTAGVEISRADLSIRHQTGWAIDALNAPASLWSWLIIFFWFGVILASSGWSVFQIKDSLTESWRNKADSYVRWHDVLKAKRPFYIAQAKWTEVRDLAIKATKSLEYATPHNIANHTWYRLLNEPKPTYVTDVEWAELRGHLSEKLGKVLVELASNAYPSGEVQRLLELKKPTNMLGEQWNLFAEKMSDRFYALTDDDLRYETNLAKLTKRLTDGPPTGVVQRVGEAYRERVASYLEAALRRQMEFEAAPYDWLAKQNVTMLSESKLASLRDRARKLSAISFDRKFVYTRPEEFIQAARPEWMEDHEYDIYKRLAEKAHLLSKRESFDHAFANKDPNEFLSRPRPEWMDPLQYATYRMMAEKRAEVLQKEEEISTKEQAVDLETIELAKRRAEIEVNRAKVLRQLEILNTFLSDPTILERIEEYDLPFASGNMEILRQISTKMR